MKFYSEVTKQLYDTEAELMAAESQVKCKPIKRMAKLEQSSGEQPAQIPTKKQLAAKVEAAEAGVNEARANLELARQQAQELSKKYLEDIDAIMNPAKQKLQDAQKTRYNAIRAFNDAYGPYTATYTGEKAADEFARAVSDMTSFFPGLFRF